MKETPFETRCAILAQLWVEERDDESYEDLFKYGDLGFPLAYAIANGIVKKTKKAEAFVDETFELLLAGFDLDDSGFETLEDIFLSDDNLVDALNSEEEDDDDA